LLLLLFLKPLSLNFKLCLIFEPIKHSALMSGELNYNYGQETLESVNKEAIRGRISLYQTLSEYHIFSLWT